MTKKTKAPKTNRFDNFKPIIHADGTVQTVPSPDGNPHARLSPATLQWLRNPKNATYFRVR